MAQVRSSRASSNQSALLQKLHQAINAQLPNTPLPSEYKITEGNSNSISIACFFKTKGEAEQFNDAIFKTLKITSVQFQNQKKTAQSVQKIKSLIAYHDQYSHVIFFAEQDIQKFMHSASLSESTVNETYNPSLVVTVPEIFIFSSLMTINGEKARAEKLMQDIEAHTILARSIQVAGVWIEADKKFSIGEDFDFNLKITANPEKLEWIRRYQHRGGYSGVAETTLYKKCPVTGKVKKFTWVSDADFIKNKSAKYTTHTPKYSMSILPTKPAAMPAHDDEKMIWLFREGDVQKKMALKNGIMVEVYSFSVNANTNTFWYVSESKDKWTDVAKAALKKHASLSDIKKFQVEAIETKNEIKHPEHLFKMPKRKLGGLGFRTKTPDKIILLLNAMYEIREAYKQDFNVPLVYMPKGKNEKDNWRSVKFIDYPMRLKAINTILATLGGDKKTKFQYDLLVKNHYKIIQNVVRDAYLEGISDQDPALNELLVFCKDNSISIQKPTPIHCTKELAEFCLKNEKDFFDLLKEKSSANQLSSFVESILSLKNSGGANHITFYINQIFNFLRDELKNSTFNSSAPTTTKNTCLGSSSTSSTSSTSASSTLETKKQHQELVSATELLYFSAVHYCDNKTDLISQFLYHLHQPTDIQWKFPHKKQSVISILIQKITADLDQLNSREIIDFYYLSQNHFEVNSETIENFYEFLKKNFQHKKSDLPYLLISIFINTIWERLTTENQNRALILLLKEIPDPFNFLFDETKKQNSHWVNLKKALKNPSELFKFWVSKSEKFTNGEYDFPIHLDFLTRFLKSFSKEADPSNEYIDVFLNEPKITGIFKWIIACYEKNSSEFKSSIEIIKLPEAFWLAVFKECLNFNGSSEPRSLRGITSLIFSKTPPNSALLALSKKPDNLDKYKEFAFVELDNWMNQSLDLNNKLLLTLLNVISSILESDYVVSDTGRFNKICNLILKYNNLFKNNYAEKVKLLVRSRVNFFQKIIDQQSSQLVPAIIPKAELASIKILLSINWLTSGAEIFQSTLQYLQLTLTFSPIDTKLLNIFDGIARDESIQKEFLETLKFQESKNFIISLFFKQKSKERYFFVYPLAHLFLQAQLSEKIANKPLDIAWEYILFSIRDKSLNFFENLAYLFKAETYDTVTLSQFYANRPEDLGGFFMAKFSLQLISFRDKKPEALSAGQMLQLLKLIPEAIRNLIPQASLKETFDLLRLEIYSDLAQAPNEFRTKNLSQAEKEWLSWVIEKDSQEAIADLDNETSLARLLLKSQCWSEFYELIQNKTPVCKEAINLKNCIQGLIEAGGFCNIAVALLGKFATGSIAFNQDQGFDLIHEAFARSEFSLIPILIEKTNFIVNHQKKEPYELLQNLIFKECYEAAEILFNKIGLTYFEFKMNPETKQSVLHLLSRSKENDHAKKLLPSLFDKATSDQRKWQDRDGNTILNYALSYGNKPLIALLLGQSLDSFSLAELHHLLAHCVLNSLENEMGQLLNYFSTNKTALQFDLLLNPLNKLQPSLNIIVHFIKSGQWDYLKKALPYISGFKEKHYSDCTTVFSNFLKGVIKDSLQDQSQAKLEIAFSSLFLKNWNRGQLIALLKVASDQKSKQLILCLLEKRPDFMLLECDSDQLSEEIQLLFDIREINNDSNFLSSTIIKLLKKQLDISHVSSLVFLFAMLFEHRLENLLIDCLKVLGGKGNDSILQNIFNQILKNKKYDLFSGLLGHVVSNGISPSLMPLLVEPLLVNIAYWIKHGEKNNHFVGILKGCLNSILGEIKNFDFASLLLLDSEVVSVFLENAKPDLNLMKQWIKALSKPESYKALNQKVKANFWKVLNFYSNQIENDLLTSIINKLDMPDIKSSEFKEYCIPLILSYSGKIFFTKNASEQRNEAGFISKSIQLLRCYLKEDYIPYNEIIPIFSTLFSINHSFSNSDSLCLKDFFKQYPNFVFDALLKMNAENCSENLGLIYYACIYGTDVMSILPKEKKSIFTLALERGIIEPLRFMMHYCDLKAMTHSDRKMLARTWVNSFFSNSSSKDLTVFDFIKDINGVSSFDFETKNAIAVIAMMYWLEKLEGQKSVMEFYEALKENFNSEKNSHTPHFLFFEDRGLFKVSVEGFGYLSPVLILFIKAIKNRLLELMCPQTQKNMKNSQASNSSMMSQNTFFSPSSNASSASSQDITSSQSSSLLDAQNDANNDGEKIPKDQILLLLGQKRGWGSVTQSQKIYDKLNSDNDFNQLEGIKLLRAEQEKLDAELVKYGYEVPNRPPIPTESVIQLVDGKTGKAHKNAEKTRRARSNSWNG